MLLFGEETGSDSLEQPALLLQVAASLPRCSPGVTAHWKDMGSKSKLEIPSAGGHRSRSSSGTHVVAWSRSAPWRLSLSVCAFSSALLLLWASSREAAEMASLVERGLRGQRGGGSPATNRTRRHRESTTGSRLPDPAVVTVHGVQGGQRFLTFGRTQRATVSFPTCNITRLSRGMRPHEGTRPDRNVTAWGGGAGL